jgi:hypothetical protein
MSSNCVSNETIRLGKKARSRVNVCFVAIRRAARIGGSAALSMKMVVMDRPHIGCRVPRSIQSSRNAAASYVATGVLKPSRSTQLIRASRGSMYRPDGMIPSRGPRSIYAQDSGRDTLRSDLLKLEVSRKGRWGCDLMKGSFSTGAHYTSFLHE